MADTTMVSVRMDTDLKRGMEEICRELGISLSTAFTIYARKVTREKRIPFDLAIDPFYSPANLAHLAQVREDVDAGRNMSLHDLIED